MQMSVISQSQVSSMALLALLRGSHRRDSGRHVPGFADAEDANVTSARLLRFELAGVGFHLKCRANR